MKMASRFWILCLAFALHSTAPKDAVAQRGWGNQLSSWNRTNGRDTLSPLKPLTQAAGAATVSVWVDSDMRAYGTVVSPTGFVITKASEIPESVTIRFGDGEAVNAQRVGLDRALDLALLRIQSSPRPAANWNATSVPSIGDFVLASKPTGARRLGVIGAPSRRIPSAGGAIGVQLGRRRGEAALGARVVRVYDASPGARAGLRAGDLITQINGVSVSDDAALVAQVKEMEAGDTALLNLVREGETLTVPLELGYRAIFDETDGNQMMSGETSDRRTGFERVLQHDIPLTANELGGPLVNLRGEVVGINIARVDRVTTYALPASLARQSAVRMIRDALRPAAQP